MILVVDTGLDARKRLAVEVQRHHGVGAIYSASYGQAFHMLGNVKLTAVVTGPKDPAGALRFLAAVRAVVPEARTIMVHGTEHEARWLARQGVVRGLADATCLPGDLASTAEKLLVVAA